MEFPIAPHRSRAFCARCFKVSVSSVLIIPPLDFGYGGGAGHTRELLALSSENLPVCSLGGIGFDSVRVFGDVGRPVVLTSPTEAEGDVRSLLE